LPILALVLTIGFISLIGAAEVDKVYQVELFMTVTVDVVEVAAVAEISEDTALLAGYDSKVHEEGVGVSRLGELVRALSLSVVSKAELLFNYISS